MPTARGNLPREAWLGAGNLSRGRIGVDSALPSTRNEIHGEVLP